MTLQDRLLAIAVLRRFGGGQRLFARGDPPDGLYCVVEGAVRITGIAESGKEALLAIIEQPHWFGEIALFDGQARTHDAWTEGATAILHFPQHALTELLASHPAYWREFGLLLAQKLRMTFLAVEEAALLSAAGRVARRLVAISEGYGEWKGRSRRGIQVSQEQLALMLSLSRQTVNQILKQLEAQGVIRLSRGGIEILDIYHLRHLAG
nr:Crp/Fnr family transcriptional regulator [Noviherbaspirillum aerium]